MTQNLIFLSLVTHHLNSHQKVKSSHDFLSTLDDHQRTQIEIISVDDCSTDAITPELGGLNLKAYRVTEDISWNQAGVRNLGCFMSDSPWILFFDVAPLPTESCVGFAGRMDFEDIDLPYVGEILGGQREIWGSSALFRDTQFKTPYLDRSSQFNHDLALKK
jgi:hypothetical protein